MQFVAQRGIIITNPERNYCLFVDKHVCRPTRKMEIVCLCVCSPDGIVTPVIVSIHGHIQAVSSPSLTAEEADSATDSDGTVNSFRTFIENAISRSERFIMQHKTILVISGGNQSKRFVWLTAKDLEIEVCL
jgi:hypothetical protein